MLERPCRGGGGGSHVAHLNFKTSCGNVYNACRLLSALPSVLQFGRGRLSLVAISFYTQLLLFGPCHLSEFTLAGPPSSFCNPLPFYSYNYQNRHNIIYINTHWFNTIKQFTTKPISLGTTKRIKNKKIHVITFTVFSAAKKYNEEWILKLLKLRSASSVVVLWFPLTFLLQPSCSKEWKQHDKYNFIG